MAELTRDKSVPLDAARTVRSQFTASLLALLVQNYKDGRGSWLAEATSNRLPLDAARSCSV